MSLKLIYPLFFLAILTVFTACTNDLNEIARITTFKEEPMEVSYDTEIIYSTKGLIKVRLKTPIMKRFIGENAYIEMEKGIDLTFFNDDMSIKSRLTADYAISKDAESSYTAKKNVVLINNKGDTLRTEHLVWNSNKEIIFSDEFVKINTPNEIIMGNGFEANQEFTRYSMKEIKAIINTK